MNRKIAMFLFAIGLAASASAGHLGYGYMDETACREYCEMQYKNCEAEGGADCHYAQFGCWSDCMHV